MVERIKVTILLCLIIPFFKAQEINKAIPKPKPLRRVAPTRKERSLIVSCGSEMDPTSYQPTELLFTSLSSVSSSENQDTNCFSFYPYIFFPSNLLSPMSPIYIHCFLILHHHWGEEGELISRRWKSNRARVGDKVLTKMEAGESFPR